MKICISCAMCGKELTFTADTFREVQGATPVADIIASHASGWITQQNGLYYDIYCSKRCAA